MNKENTTYNKLFEAHGPMIQNRALYQALGFNSYRVFYEHLRNNQISLKIFKINGRRGWFAKTKDVADWIDNLNGESA